MKYIYSILIFFVYLGALQAQQLPQFSQYARNQYMVNPGAAGVYDFTDITLGGRRQWSGLADAPKTSYLSASLPLSVFKNQDSSAVDSGLEISTGLPEKAESGTGQLKHAVGIQGLTDQFGAFRTVGLSGTYAIHMPVTARHNLSFGTNVGLVSHTFFQEKAIVSTASGDNTYLNYVNNRGHVNRLNVGVGLYFYSEELFFGIAADQLTKDWVTFGSGSADFDSRVHFNVSGGYIIQISEDYSLTPSFLVKCTEPVLPAVEGTVQFEYKKWMWAALSYRHKDALIGMVGMNLNERFKVGYSFDCTLSPIRKYGTGGHELVLGLMLGRKN
jgi:type IX secretion system PorP/SprF family membrane protein